jgi:hypothetical protein
MAVIVTGGYAIRDKGMAMTEVTIYHNPACGTSRRVLAMLRDKGVEPRGISFGKTTTLSLAGIRVT